MLLNFYAKFQFRRRAINLVRSPGVEICTRGSVRIFNDTICPIWREWGRRSCQRIIYGGCRCRNKTDLRAARTIWWINFSSFPSRPDLSALCNTKHRRVWRMVSRVRGNPCLSSFKFKLQTFNTGKKNNNNDEHFKRFVSWIINFKLAIWLFYVP